MLGGLVKSRIVAPRVAQRLARTYMEGPGGRFENNTKVMQGMTWKSLKHHWSLIPLYLTMGLAMSWVTFYTARLAFLTTDANWSKKKDWNEMPWEYYRNRQFQFMNPSNKEYKCQAPDYRVQNE